MDRMIDREVAWRVFAHEFNSSTLSYSEGDERAPNYVITPTGAKCNRLFVVGVATEVENIGAEGDLWRARIADPTGVFTVYAGQYQSEAAIFLSKLQVPAFVAVIGKARTYKPEERTVYVSIRPEEINISDEANRDYWVLDTAERTLERIRIMGSALKSGLKGEELTRHLVSIGVNRDLADGAARAFAHYPSLEEYLEGLRQLVLKAVEMIAREVPVKREEVAQAEAGSFKTLESKPSPREKIDEIMSILDAGKGVKYSDLLENALREGLTSQEIEAAIKELMGEGRCYEARVGVLRKVWIG